MKSASNQIQELPDESGKSSGRWTKEEHQRFVDGLKKFGKNWKLVEDYVGTRNGAQIRSHAQKFFNRLERELHTKSDPNKSSGSRKIKDKSLRKNSDFSDSTNCSAEENAAEENNIQSTSPPLNDSEVSQPLPTETKSMPPNSPKLNVFETPEEYRRPPRKMSADIPLLHTSTTSTNQALLNLVMSKFQTSIFSPPKLSDLVEQPKSQLTAIHTTSVNPISASFRPNPRKMSEDNVLFQSEKLNNLRKPELSEFDLVIKKIKPNE